MDGGWTRTMRHRGCSPVEGRYAGDPPSHDLLRLKRINNLDFIGARILKLVQNDISYYAMHTNYDVLGMAELSGRKMSLEDPEVLEVTRDGEQPEGIGRVADLASPAPSGNLLVCEGPFSPGGCESLWDMISLFQGLLSHRAPARA